MNYQVYHTKVYKNQDFLTLKKTQLNKPFRVVVYTLSISCFGFWCV